MENKFDIPAADFVEISSPEQLPENPVVSVHMLAYNHAPYLAEAIEGVIGQKTDFPIELVIGEDCSTDNTREIALDYQRRYPSLIRVVCSYHNVGMMANLYRVTTACRGQFIAFCEGDDYWHHPNKLQIQVTFLLENPDYCLVHTDWNHIVSLLGRWRIRENISANTAGQVKNGWVYNAYQQNKLFIMTCTAMMSRKIACDFFGSNLNWPEYLVGDWPLFAYAAAHGKIYMIPVSTATYRRVAGSAMNSGAAAGVRRARNALIIYKDFDGWVSPVNVNGWDYRLSVGPALYGNAIWARDRVAMIDGYSLIASCGGKPSSKIKRIYDQLTVNSRLVYSFRLYYRTLRSAISQMRHYKKMQW